MGSARTTAWPSSRKAKRRTEIRRGLPGDAADEQSRYLEAEVKGLVVASIYLPNGNPQPGPKFDYKLAWFERLIKHAETLYASGRPVVLAGDFNVVPTNADIYNAWLWRDDAVMQPAKPRRISATARAGMDGFNAAPPPQRENLHVLGQRERLPAQCRFSHGLPAAHPSRHHESWAPPASIPNFAAGNARATTLQLGSR